MNETDEKRSKRFKDSHQRSVPFTEEDFPGASKMTAGRRNTNIDR